MLNHAQNSSGRKLVSLFCSPENSGEESQEAPGSRPELTLLSRFLQETSRAKRPQDAESLPVAGIITFRKAQIHTDDMEELLNGLWAGQACAADLLESGIPLTSQILATHLSETMLASDPEEYNVGFLIGFLDALCRARTIAPSISRRKGGKKHVVR